MSELLSNQFTRNLTIQDFDECIILESKGFPPEQRCSPENCQYRLSVASKFCLGLFETTPLGDSKLIGHILATKISTERITEAGMGKKIEGVENSGHFENSRNIGIHSVVIDPEYRGVHLGHIFLTKYIKYIRQFKLADKILIINKESLIPFYLKVGFENLGLTDCRFAGLIDYDMVYNLSS